VFICVHLWLNPSVRSRAAPPKLSTEHQLYLSAQRALMRRAYSLHDMRAHLERRAENKELIPTVIARLRELHYLDDARYALDFARSRVRSHRGRFRIARELRARGVPDTHIEAALNAVFAETDEASLVHARLKRRLAQLRGKLDQRKLAQRVVDDFAGGSHGSRKAIGAKLHDGMNLVAKEFVAARHDMEGALILSQFTGAMRELRDALIVNPYDTDQLADAILLALEMDPQDRRTRMRRMRQIVKENNVYRWAGNLIAELSEIRIDEVEPVAAQRSVPIAKHEKPGHPYKLISAAHR